MRTAVPVAIFLFAAALLPQPPQFRQVTIPTGPSPRAIAVADVNHDGNPDLIITNEGTDNTDSGTITVLLGDGRGAFHQAPGSPFPAGHLPNDIAVADMNHDGNLDLVVANHQSPYLRVFLGDGRGSFHLAPGSPVDVHSTPHPHGVVVADFNSDGKPDAVTDSWGNNQIELLLGDGAGGLRTPGTFFATGRRPYERLRTADFNHDGIPDIVTTNLDDDTVSILLGDGHGGLHNAPGSPIPAGGKPWQIAIDDLNGDGNPDLVIIPYQRDIRGPAENAVTVLLGNGHGGFHPMPGSPLPLGDLPGVPSDRSSSLGSSCQGPNSVAAGDLSGRGAHAIAVACAESRTLRLYLPAANGQYTPSSMQIAGGWGSVVIARLTAGPRSALITANADAGSITIYFPE